MDVSVEQPLRWVAWKDDGASALLVGNRGTILKFENGRFEPVASPTEENLRGVDWAPDGRSAIIVGNSGTVLRYREQGVSQMTSLTTQNIRRVDFRPDGRFAIAVGNNGTVLRIESGGTTIVPTERAYTLRSVAYRPDGAYALVGAYASRWVGHPRPHALYRCDGSYLTALMSTDDEDDFLRINWHHDGRTALVVGHGWHINSEGHHNKVFTYDGFGYHFYRVPSDAHVLGGAWKPNTDEALIVGDEGSAMWFSNGDFKPLHTGTDEPLIGPYWHPSGEWAIVLTAAKPLYTT
jgi:hypothetical protein